MNSDSKTRADQDSLCPANTGRISAVVRNWSEQPA